MFTSWMRCCNVDDACVPFHPAHTHPTDLLLRTLPVGSTKTRDIGTSGFGAKDVITVVVVVRPPPPPPPPPPQKSEGLGGWLVSLAAAL